MHLKTKQSQSAILREKYIPWEQMEVEMLLFSQLRYLFSTVESLYVFV